MHANHSRSAGRLAQSAIAFAAVALAACGDSGKGIAAPEQASSSVTCTPQVTVDMAVGQVRSLSAAEAACIRMAPHASARYVLAAFDARGIDGARRSPETTPLGDPTYTLTDGTGSTPASGGASPNRAPSAAAAQGDLRLAVSASSSAADETDPFKRAAPWREGDTFPVRHLEGGDVVTARVVKVLDGRYVVAVVDADVPSGKFAGDVGRALDFMSQKGFAVLDRTFGQRRPVTSAASGQLLVLLTAWNPDNGAGATWTTASPDGSGVFSYVLMNTNMRGGVRTGYEMYDFVSFRLKVLSHELTHAWQMRYAYETQDGQAERHVNMGPAWSMEGCADLVSMDVLRRYLDIGLTDNWDWSRKLYAGNEAVIYALEPADQRGMLPRGYFDGASFLRDVQVRMVRRGAAADEALAQVARGAVEGWWGIDASNVRRQGLTERVRAVLGADWDPSQAVLLWTLTQAADDLTDNPELDNAVYSHAGDPDEQYAWKAAFDDVRLGRAFSRTLGSSSGSSFFARLSDDGSGGTLAARSTDASARWMLARVK
jgi:hypothetical protein